MNGDKAAIINDLIAKRKRLDEQAGLFISAACSVRDHHDMADRGELVESPDDCVRRSSL